MNWLAARRLRRLTLQEPISDAYGINRENNRLIHPTIMMDFSLRKFVLFLSKLKLEFMYKTPAIGWELPLVSQ